MRFTSPASLIALACLFLEVTARLTVLGHGEKGKIPNSYIVVFHPTVNETQMNEHTHHIGHYHAHRKLEVRGKTAGIHNHFNMEHKGPGFKGYMVECDPQTLDQILRSPEEFEKRASWGYNAVAGSPNSDQNGHGTHVAGIAAGKNFGVAKLAKIVAVKVLDANGNGKVSYTLAGLNYVSGVAKSGKSVINMSLGGARSQSLNDAVEALYKKGIIVVVAAGNDADVASAYSPASAKDAITVGATDIGDGLADFSNYGFYIDILAPGVDILSSWATSNTATNTQDGTSMAAPHVAGLAAYLLSSTTVTQSPLTIYNKLISLSLKNVIGFVPSGTANQFAYNGFS
ncbi:Oryzin [Arthrobotrys entomopaga]|nr:Oryzin [Arthrobotrys entomopaga]